MTEAPYSWNARVIGAEGWEEQYTVRAISADGFAKRVAALKVELIGLGYHPAPSKGNGSSASASAPASEAQAQPAQPDKVRLCPKHGTPLEKREGKNGGFSTLARKRITVNGVRGKRTNQASARAPGSWALSPTFSRGDTMSDNNELSTQEAMGC